MADTLATRAARYFGYLNRPRTSIRMNNHECLLVGGGDPQWTIVMHYSERYQQTGTFVKLTPRARDELLAALEAQR